MFAKSNINVSINISGDVENSQIVGVQLTNPDGSSRVIAGSLFRKFFIEYLGLPSLLELRSRIDISKASRTGRLHQYDGVDALWFDLVAHLRHTVPLDDALIYGGSYAPRPTPAAGSVVQLHNVQLTRFVNRNPGYQYAYGTTSASELAENEMLVGAPLIVAEDFIARNGGLGDIRFARAADRYLLNAVPVSGTLDYGGIPVDELARRDLKEVFSPKGEFPFGSPWLGHLHTGYGFPVVVSELVYDSLKSIIDDFGAVRVETLTGALELAPSQPSVQWYPGIPKLALCVEDRVALRGTTKPQPFVASAWTVVVDRQGRQRFAYWPFFVGIEVYKESLDRATQIIREEISRLGAEPLFEFDSEVNWFSTGTAFNPDTFVGLYKTLEGNDVVHKQKYRQDIAHLYEIVLSDDRREQASTLEWEFGSGATQDGRMEAATRSCAAGIAEMRAGNLQNAIDYFTESLNHWPVYVWPCLFQSMSFYLSGQLESSTRWATRTLEAAADALVQPREPHGFRSNTLSAWYLLCWVWYDYVQNEGREIRRDMGFVYGFTEQENLPTHWNVSSSGLYSDWPLIIPETLHCEDYKHVALNLDEVFKTWMPGRIPITLQANIEWVIQNALTAYLQTNATRHGRIAGPARERGIRQQIAKRGETGFPAPASPFLMKLKDAMGNGFFSTVGIRYPYLSNDRLRAISEAPLDVAVEALSSESYRERRIAERRLKETSNLSFLLNKLLPGPPRHQQAFAWIIGEIARNNPEVRRSLRKPLVELASQEKFVGVQYSAFSACIRTQDVECGNLLFDTYAKRGDFGLQRFSSAVTDLGGDANWFVVLGLKHHSPSLRRQFVEIACERGNQEMVAAVQNMALAERDPSIRSRAGVLLKARTDREARLREDAVE